jgi:hypothetical protein
MKNILCNYKYKKIYFTTPAAGILFFKYRYPLGLNFLLFLFLVCFCFVLTEFILSNPHFLFIYLFFNLFIYLFTFFIDLFLF